MDLVPDMAHAAEKSVQELRAALAAAGITLPSLGLDPVTAAADTGVPLVDLGRCTPETVRRLAEAVAAARPDGTDGTDGTA